MSERYKVFLAQPNAGRIWPQCMMACGRASDGRHDVVVQPNQFGDVAHNFNMQWCHALNLRKEHSFTHFAMIHADLDVQGHWLDTLLDEMDRLDAEVMTTTIAIKDMRGITTTGIRFPGVWGTRRFCMSEIMRMPETIGIADVGDPATEVLAINTGCWVARITTGWADKFPGFIDKYKITIEHGEHMAWFDSEDWLFSDWLAREKIPYYTTRKVQAAHIGEIGYPNGHVWGTQDTDFQCPAKPITPALQALPDPRITIETEKPVALDSHDHVKPWGTVRDNTSNREFNRKLFELIPVDRIRVLDLGCAGGGFVRSILEAGGFAVGVEGSDISRNSKRAEWGIIPSWLFTADAREPFQLLNGKPLKFNVITGWEFLEHIEKEALGTVLENIRKHAEPDALFLASISQSREEWHKTVEPRGWWEDRLGVVGIWRDAEIEAHFGDTWVRGSSKGDPSSFVFGGRIQDANPLIITPHMGLLDPPEPIRK